MLLRTCLTNIQSGLNPWRAQCHVRFVSEGMHLREVASGRQRLREIVHLDPQLLKEQQQPRFDISGKRHARFSVLCNGEYKSVRVYYHYKDKIHHQFPKHTQGHLYYRAPPLNHPGLSGSFRFRVLAPDQDFADGTDLLRPDGHFWELSLYNAIQYGGFAPLVRKILDERLLDVDLLNAIDELPQSNLNVSSGVLYALSDPFSISLDQTKMISIITEQPSVKFRLRPFTDERLGRLPFTGEVLARFEKSELPEHAQKRAVVIRILEILSPVECVIPGYDFHIQSPEPGQLIARRTRYSGYYPWSIDVSDGVTPAARCLRLLFPEDENASPEMEQAG